MGSPPVYSPTNL